MNWSQLDALAFPSLLEMKATVITPGGRVGSNASTGSRSNGENWVERSPRGRLPEYIRIVRNGLMKQGKSEGQATALAVAAMKRWARGGDNVRPAVQAAAAKALAEWEAMKAGKGWFPASEAKRMTAKQRRKKPCMPGTDDKYPIGNVEDLKNAIRLSGHSSEPVEKVRAWIKKRARELNAYSLIPDNWSDQKSFSDNEIETKTGSPAGEDMHIEHKVVGVNGVKVLDDEEDGVVEAFVSVTGVKDNVSDIIHPGAYEKTLAARLPKGVWSHDWDKPVSKTLAIKELLPGDSELPEKLPNGEPWPAEAGALKIKMQFNLGTERGRDAYSDVTFFGEQQEWSIGYHVPRGGATLDTKAAGGPVRNIKNLDLYEFSPVLFGAMPNARTSSVKEAQIAYKSLMGEDVDHWLDEMKSWMGDNDIEQKELDLEEKGGEEEIDLGGELDSYDTDLLNLIEESSEKGLLSAENLDLLTKAVDVLNDLLTAALPVFEAKSFANVEHKELSDVITAVKEADVLDEDTFSSLAEHAERFDAAIKADDPDATEESATAVLDIVDDALDSASDEAVDGLKSIAAAVHNILVKMDGEEEEVEEEEEDDPENEEVEEETETEEEKDARIALETKQLAELGNVDEFQSFLDSLN